MLNHGLDPATGERFDEGAFETALRQLLAHRHRVKEGRRAKSELESEGSNGEPELAREVLTPLAANSDPVSPMLRQIKRRLGPAKSPLPDPKSLHWPPAPARSPIPTEPQKESLGSSSCRPAKVSRYTNT
jgi:hypothetical protein